MLSRPRPPPAAIVPPACCGDHPQWSPSTVSRSWPECPCEHAPTSQHQHSRHAHQHPSSASLEYLGHTRVLRIVIIRWSHEPRVVLPPCPNCASATIAHKPVAAE